jgi:hypothetical protein
VCHCAGWLADSLADNQAAAVRRLKAQLASRGCMRTTARFRPRISRRLRSAASLSVWPLSEMTSLEGRQRRLMRDYRRRSMLVRFRR